MTVLGGMQCLSDGEAIRKFVQLANKTQVRMGLAILLGYCLQTYMVGCSCIGLLVRTNV